MYSPSVNYREPIKGVDKNSVKMHYVYNLLLAYFMALSLIFFPPVSVLVVEKPEECWCVSWCACLLMELFTVRSAAQRGA